MQVIRSPKVYPVVVVGSGASGGMAAWNLTRQGINVVLLDAGTKFDRSKYWTHVRSWEARERKARGEKEPQFYLDTKEQPYVTPEGKPFELIRVWGHGGKTNVWAVPAGATIFAIIFAGTRFLDFWPLSLFSSGERAYLRLIFVGLALIVLVIWRPQGIFGNRREDALES